MEATDLSESNSVDVAYENVTEEPWMNNIKLFCIQVMDKLKLKKYQLSVLICTDDIIKKLNQQYRGIDRPTDVLAFGQMYDGEPVPHSIDDDQMSCLGDIVVSMDTCKNNAALYKLPYQEEMKRLLIHGILHLIGMEHNENNSKMIKKQENLLRYFNNKKCNNKTEDFPFSSEV
jgi:probable rRNA maturation factor